MTKVAHFCKCVCGCISFYIEYFLPSFSSENVSSDFFKSNFAPKIIFVWPNGCLRTLVAPLALSKTEKEKNLATLVQKLERAPIFFDSRTGAPATIWFSS